MLMLIVTSSARNTVSSIETARKLAKCRWIVFHLCAALIVLVGCVRSTRCSIVASDIEAIRSALEAYAADHSGWYPDALERLLGEVSGKNYPYLQPATGRFLDPWGNQYVYVRTNGKRLYELYSLGADGKSGGVGDDADRSR